MQNSREFDVRRRDLMVGAAARGGVTTAPSLAGAQPAAGVPSLKVAFTVNGKARELELDTRTTLLDALREGLHSPAPRRMRSRPVRRLHGDRRRPAHQFLPDAGGDAPSGSITTVEGLGRPGYAPMQAAF